MPASGEAVLGHRCKKGNSIHAWFAIDSALFNIFCHAYLPVLVHTAWRRPRKHPYVQLRFATLSRLLPVQSTPKLFGKSRAQQLQRFIEGAQIVHASDESYFVMPRFAECRCSPAAAEYVRPFKTYRLEGGGNQPFYALVRMAEGWHQTSTDKRAYGLSA